MKKTSEVLKTLGNKNCNKAIRMLALKSMSVAEVQRGLKISQPATSQTLGKLSKIGAVRYEEKGREHIYGIGNPAMLGLINLADGIVAGPA